MMIINDKIYGSFHVEPVLEELILSAPVQRLRHIHQGGGIFLVNPDINHTRYDHSLGVLFLVQYFGGSLEEQIAALLHDVSHTAFSHVADYVFDHANEDYHETIFEEVINRSEVPDILQKFGFDSTALFNASYTILEQPLPALCADRVDYTLRDLNEAGLINQADINRFIQELIVQDGRLVVKTEAAGNWIRDKFTILNEAYFKKPEHVYVNLKLAELIKAALDSNVLQKADLLRDDFQVLRKLNADSRFCKRLDDIRNSKNFSQFAGKGAAERFKQRSLHPGVMA